MSSIIKLFIFGFFLAVSFGLHREITVKQLMQDEPCNFTSNDEEEFDPDAKKVYMFYTKAQSEFDSIHYLVSGGGFLGPFTCVLIHSPYPDSTLKVNWNELCDRKAGAITLDKPQNNFTTGFVFSRLIEYNDTADNSTIDSYIDPEVFKFYPFDEKHFVWSHDNTTFYPNNTIVFRTEDKNLTSNESLYQKDGYFELRFLHNGNDSIRMNQLPSLLFTGNNTMVDMTLHSFENHFLNSRFSIETTFFSSRYVQFVPKTENDTMTSTEETNFDDEYTPGVFKMVNWFGQPLDFSSSYNWTSSVYSSYFQFKPICYFDEYMYRSVLSSTLVDQLVLNRTCSEFDKKSGLYDSLNNSVVLAALFGEDNFCGDNLVLSSSNISLGYSNDGFYRSINHTSWTFSFGYGMHPEDSISAAVIAIIACGFGLPFLMMVVSLIYVCFRGNKNSSQSVYEAIN